jgi:hypothetical protein
MKIKWDHFRKNRRRQPTVKKDPQCQTEARLQQARWKMTAADRVEPSTTAGEAKIQRRDLNVIQTKAPIQTSSEKYEKKSIHVNRRRFSGASATPGTRLGGGEKKPNPNFGSVCYIMNNTCIHLRVKGLNIYMYMRGRIYKEPRREIQ